MTKTCLKCGSIDTIYNKVRMFGKNGVTFHIRKDCTDCKAKKYVPRSKEAYEETKNKPWFFTDAHLKKMKKLGKQYS